MTRIYMKKILTVVAATILACSAVSAQSFKLVNTFGGDSVSTGGSDLFVFENQKDENGNYKNEFSNTTRASNRLQLDASSKMFDARLRMEIGTTKLNGKDSTVRFRGYGRFKPVDQFNLIAGNDLFTKVPVNAGYLVASDDYPKYARILQNGFGAVSNWAFGDEKNVTMNLAAGVKGDDGSFLDPDKLGLDFGFNFGIKDIMTAGGSFQNVTGNKFTASAFAGLSAVKNLTLNAGYIYNATDTDFIPSVSKNVVSVTAGYNFKDIGLLIGADAACGLTNEYLDEGVTKNYQNDGKYVIPFQTKVLVTYNVNDSLSVGVKAKVTAMLGNADSVKTEIYPNVTYDLPNKFGSLTSGVRISTDKNGISKFAIPFSWKCTLADIKK